MADHFYKIWVNYDSSTSLLRSETLFSFLCGFFKLLLKLIFNYIIVWYLCCLFNFENLVTMLHAYASLCLWFITLIGVGYIFRSPARFIYAYYYCFLIIGGKMLISVFYGYYSTSFEIGNPCIMTILTLNGDPKFMYF